MKNIELAFVLFQKSQNDFKALSNMADTEIFSDDVFGFRAQQAIEKAIKAWLVFLKVCYPKTHDIKKLFQLLEQKGYDISPYHDFTGYSDYAIQYLSDEPVLLQGQTLDRHECIQQVSVLLNHVDRIINEK